MQVLELFSSIMKKYIVSSIAICLLSIVPSCYKYEPLDLSNIHDVYYANISEDAELKWRNEALAKYGPVLIPQYYGERWSSGVEECDKDGKVLYKGRIRKDAAIGTHYVNVYDTFFIMTPHREYAPLCSFMHTSDTFPSTPAPIYINITEASPYNIVVPGDDVARYEYKLTCYCAEMLTKVSEYGYEIADAEYYNLEMDSNNNVVAKKKQKDADWTEKGVTTVAACIDVYGWRMNGKYVDYTTKELIFTIRFSAIDARELNHRLVELNESHPHFFVLPSDLPTQYPYKLTCHCNKMYSMVSEYGYEIADAEYYNLEMDSNNNVVAKKKQKDGTWTEIGVTSIVSCIDVYGWKKTGKNVDYSTKEMIFTIKFSPLKVEDVEYKEIELNESNPHSYYLPNGDVIECGDGSGGGTVNPLQNKFWDFGAPAFNSLGTITSSTTVDGLTIMATSDKPVVIEPHSITLTDGTVFTHRLKLGGTGAENYRNINFMVEGNCRIRVYAKSSGSDTRQLKISVGSFQADTENSWNIVGDAYTHCTFNYTVNKPNRIYIFSGGSGINLYTIEVTYN